MRLRHFYKHFVKNTRKKGPAEKNLGVFSPRYPWNHILNGNFNSNKDTVRAFFTKSEQFFLYFQNRAWKASPSPLLVARLLPRLNWLNNKLGDFPILKKRISPKISPKPEQNFIFLVAITTTSLVILDI